MKNTVIILVLAAWCCTACVHMDEIDSFDGFVDPSEMRASYGKPEVQFTVGKKMLRLSSMMVWTDRSLAGLLSGMDGVRIEVYRLHQDSSLALHAMLDTTERLMDMGWEALVDVNNGDKQTRILVKVDEDSIDGVVILSMDAGREATFINAIGDITPNRLFRLTWELDTDADT